MPTDQPQKALMEAMKRLYLSDKHSDFRIKCQDDVYPVHKAIICPRSDFFDAATRFGMEAEENQVDLAGDEPLIVKLMLEYFYHLDYQIPGTADGQPLSVRFIPEHPVQGANFGWRRSLANGLASLDKDAMAAAVKIVQVCAPGLMLIDQVYVLNQRWIMKSSSFETDLRNLFSNTGTPWGPVELQNAPVVHAKMYAIADKYNILGLKELAIEKFKATTEDHFTSPGFYDAIDIIYTTTPEDDTGLRDVVARLICDDIEVFGWHARAEEKLESVPDLALRVMKMHFGPKGCGEEGRA